MQGGHHKPLAGIESLVRILTPAGSSEDPNIAKVYNFLNAICDPLMMTTIHEGVRPGAFEIHSNNGMVWSIHTEGNNDQSLQKLEVKLKAILDHHNSILHPHSTPVQSFDKHSKVLDKAHAHEHHTHEKKDHEGKGTHSNEETPKHHTHAHHYHDAIPTKDHKHHNPNFVPAVSEEEKPCAGIEGRLLFRVDRMSNLPPTVKHVVDFLNTQIDFAIVSESGMGATPGSFDIISGGDIIWSLGKEGAGAAGILHLKNALHRIKKEMEQDHLPN